MSEQLALDQVRVDGAAVHRNEGPLGTRTEIVDRAGRQFLARTALADQQNVRPRVGQPFDRPEDVLHGGTATDHATELLTPLHLVAQLADLVLESTVLQQLPDLQPKRIEFEGLGDEVRCAVLHRLDRDAQLCRSRYHHHWRGDAARLQVGEQIQSARTRHHDVEQDQIRRMARDRAQRGIHVAGGCDVELLLEQHPQGFLDACLVIDHEHALHGRTLAGWAPQPTGQTGPRELGRAAAAASSLRRAPPGRISSRLEPRSGVPGGRSSRPFRDRLHRT